MSRILWPIIRTRGHRFVADVIFEPRDLWVGVYWSSYISTASRRCVRVYLALWPMLPVRCALVLWRVRTGWPGDSYDEGALDE